MALVESRKCTPVEVNEKLLALNESLFMSSWIFLSYFNGVRESKPLGGNLSDLDKRN